MKLGVMNPVLNNYPFEKALEYLHSLGVQCVELGAGGYPGDAHIKPSEIIGHPEKVKESNPDRGVLESCARNILELLLKLD